MEPFKEDTDVFEITDFTTASDWERFIASLEEIFNDWKLSTSTTFRPLQKNDMTHGLWKQEKDQISFADFKFNITRHYLTKYSGDDEETPIEPAGTQLEPMETKVDRSSSLASSRMSHEGEDENPLPVPFHDIINCTNDFPAKAHCLVRWFGLRDFIILSCGTTGESVSSESRVKILLSSINIAINSTGCSVPVFLEVDKPSRKLYFGVCEGAGMRLDFDMAALKRFPHHLHYMSGLVDMFTKRLGCPITAVPKITVSVRFTYSLNNWASHLTPGLLDNIDDEINYTQFQAGPLEDPITDLFISTTWPHVDSLMVADSDVYSDLDPLSAPQWHMRAAYLDRPSCNLCETIRQFMKLCKRRETMQELFRHQDDENDSSQASTGQPKLSKAFERLTESRVHMPNISSAVRSATSGLRIRKMQNAPLSDSFVDELMEFIFSKDESHSSTASATEASSESCATCTPGKPFNNPDIVKDIERQFKCAPVGSITHRMAICFACLNRHSGGIHAVAQLWQEVLVELRTRWEAALYIPDLGGGTIADPPNLGTSLFHQKLQMINCCIARKVARDNSTEDTEDDTEDTTEVEIDDGSEEDFFDCNEELPTTQSHTEIAPSGRKEEIGFLHDHPEIPMFVPFTQEAAPMTEDMVEEQTKQLARLGTSLEGASQRARMQCASLIADMEAFKAANPKASLIDFVRWYSPRDIIEDENGGATLSPRMQVADNLWVEAWQEAKPVRARLQKRLFDDTAEAERAFIFLEELRPADLCANLLPNVFAEAVIELGRYGLQFQLRAPEIPNLVETLLERGGLATRSAHLGEGARGLLFYDEVLRRTALVEVMLARAASLEMKLMRQPSDPMQEEEEAEHQVLVDILTRCLSDEPEVALVGAARGPAGQALQRLLQECVPPENNAEAGIQTRFPEATGKEYILRTEYPLPTPAARIAPQRLYCAVQREDYRLCGAFSRDTMFY